MQHVASHPTYMYNIKYTTGVEHRLYWFELQELDETNITNALTVVK